MLRIPCVAMLLIITANLFPGSLFADSLRPFSSDGCSVFPDGTSVQQEMWLSCCTAHDFAYWRGGTEQQRQQADLALQQCVAAVADDAIANLMLAGVRVGGSPWWPTPFRWGYGWSYPRGYRELSDEERQQLRREMHNSDSQHLD